MTFEHDHQPRHAPRFDDSTGSADVEPSVVETDAQRAWQAIQAFAHKGKGKPSDLPRLFERIGNLPEAQAVLPEIAKRAPGAIVLACAEQLDTSLDAQLALALGAKQPAATAELLRHLQRQTEYSIVQLDANEPIVTALRQRFPGPMAHTLPAIARLPASMHDKTRLVRWYIESTNPTVAALAILRAPHVSALAPTLDAIGGWGWLDHVQITRNWILADQLVVLRDATTAADAKRKLAAFAAAVTADETQREREQAAANAELPAQLAGNDDAALLDTASRSLIPNVDRKQAATRLAGESPELVLQFVIAADIDTDVKQSIELMLGASADNPGAKAECLRSLMRESNAADVVDALKRDTLRSRVRKVIGRDASLLELLSPSWLEEAHAIVVGDEALRQWVYEDKHPRTTLWLAAGSGGGARLGCRHVRAEKGNGWVDDLPFHADEVELRRFVLNSTDAKAVKFVKQRYLHDRASEVDGDANDVVAIDSAVYGAGDKARLQIATMDSDAEAATALARLADLSDADRHALLADPKAINRLLDDVFGDDLVRAVYLLAPSVTQLLQMAIPNHFPAAIGYIATRSAAEQLAALRKPASLRAARKMVGPGNSPFVVFPALYTPSSLAKALEGNDALLEWMFDDTEPSWALTTLARDPVRSVATATMQQRATVYAWLPSYDHLTADARRAFDAIAKGFDDDESKTDSESYRDGDVAIEPALDRRAEALADAGEGGDLAAAITKLDRAGAADKPAMLALVRAALPAQQVALLDGSHPREVRVVRRVTKLPPQHVFPGVTVARLFGLDDAVEWLLVYEAPTTLLALAVANKAARPLAKALDARADDLTWIEALPRGGALVASEHHLLDEISRHVTNAAVLKALFAARFDVAIEGSFDFAEVTTLWSIAQRLPAAQFDQQAIRAINEKDIAALGQWANPDIELDDDAARFKGDDISADLGQKLTLDEIKRHYKMTDQEIAVASQDNGWLVLDNGLYTVKPIHTDQFTATVLHEIGHSIDTLLGEHTDLVFGIGGWRTYGLDQFEQWADEMGGLDAIDAADRPKVIEAWKQALRVNKSAGDLVGDDHPAKASKYGASPLVKAAVAGHGFYYNSSDQPVIRDRVFLNRNGLLSSIPNQTFQTAPSHYSLYAPAEFFAECYVEYYREFDGTKQSGKGSRLAGWIKQWFEAYVDKIKLNPNRVRPT